MCKYCSTCACSVHLFKMLLPKTWIFPNLWINHCIFRVRPGWFCPGFGLFIIFGLVFCRPGMMQGYGPAPTDKKKDCGHHDHSGMWYYDIGQPSYDPSTHVVLRSTFDNGVFSVPKSRLRYSGVLRDMLERCSTNVRPGVLEEIPVQLWWVGLKFVLIFYCSLCLLHDKLTIRERGVPPIFDMEIAYQIRMQKFF